METNKYIRVIGIALLVATVIVVRIFSGAKYDDGDINAKYLRDDFGMLAWSVGFTPPARSKNFRVFLQVTTHGVSSNIALLECASPALNSDSQILVYVQGKDAVIRFNETSDRGRLPFDTSLKILRSHNLGGSGNREETNQFVLLEGEDRILRVRFEFDQLAQSELE